MTRHIERRLRALAEEMTSLRAELGVLGEQLAFQQDVVQDARVRALVAETPLADRELRVASEDLRRIQRALDEAATRLQGLLTEQDRLLAELLPEPTTG